MADLPEGLIYVIGMIVFLVLTIIWLVYDLLTETKEEAEDEEPSSRIWRFRRGLGIVSSLVLIIVIIVTYVLRLQSLA